jgi:hypothetical protein
MRLSRPRICTLLVVALAAFATAPAWIVRHPPLQDLPLHVATTRVLHSFHDPAFGFDGSFELTLGRTQYLSYYLLASALAYVTGIHVANVLAVSAYLAGTPLAAMLLCRALGKDERLAIFTVPLLVNVMFALGLLPFLLGVPILLAALAASVAWLDEIRGPRRRERLRALGVAVGGLSLLLFFTHVFPFGLFGLGFAAMFPWRRPRAWLLAGLPVVPALGATAWWLAFTPSGAIARASGDDTVAPLDEALRNLDKWTMDVFKDTTDEKWLVALAIAALLAWGLSQGDEDRARPAARALVAVPIACVLLYFRAAQDRGPVWLVAQRFPILGAMALVPLLRFPRGGARGAVATVAATVVAVGSIMNVCRHYVAFERDEVGNIDGAIAQIPPRARVASLVFDKYSSVVNWGPFVHFGSYYQAARGGVVEFTYAGFAHWPLSFKPGAWPPHAGLPPDSKPPRDWEWRPEDVPVQGELYPWYDYVLERGDGFHPPPATFHLKWRDGKWAVWERD